MKRLSEKEILQELRSFDIPPLKIDIREFPKSGGRKGYSPDLYIDVGWSGETRRFVTEISPVATPKLIASAVAQLEAFRQETAKDTYPMIVAPYLSKPQFQELADRKISAIDLSGNVLLIVPGELLIERIANPNRFPSNSPIKNVYRGTSSIVGRVMLSRSEYASVSEVYEETKNRGAKITLATVSKVLKELDDDFIITRKERIKLIDAERLLDKLRSNYQGTKTTRQRIGKVTSVQNALKKIDLNCLQSGMRYAVDEPQKYIIFPTAGEPVRIYTESIPDALEGIDFEDTTRFADLELIETNEEFVYFDRTRDSKQKRYYTSPLQIYLELSQKGKREQEVAGQLVNRIITGGKESEG